MLDSEGVGSTRPVVASVLIPVSVLRTPFNWSLLAIIVGSNLRGRMQDGTGNGYRNTLFGLQPSPKKLSSPPGGESPTNPSAQAGNSPIPQAGPRQVHGRAKQLTASQTQPNPANSVVGFFNPGSWPI